MDLPGFTAPGGEFPFLTGPGPKIARLRRAGYDTLLATEPSTEVALRPSYLRAIRNIYIAAYSPTARYYLDWEDDLERSSPRRPTRCTGTGRCYVIDLRRAQRHFPRATGSGSQPRSTTD